MTHPGAVSGTLACVFLLFMFLLLLLDLITGRLGRGRVMVGCWAWISGGQLTSTIIIDVVWFVIVWV